MHETRKRSYNPSHAIYLEQGDTITKLNRRKETIYIYIEEAGSISHIFLLTLFISHIREGYLVEHLRHGFVSKFYAEAGV